MENVLDSTVIRCFTRMVYEAATPYAYRMLRHLKAKKWVELVASAPDPRRYTDARTFQTDAVIGNFFKKYQDLDLGIDLKAKAERSFYENEALCYISNERLAPYTHRAFSSTEQGLCSFIDSVRKEVKNILGRLPSTLKGRFGPGSTYGDRGKYTTLPDKMSSCPTITSGAAPLLPLWEETAWARFGCNRLNLDSEHSRKGVEQVKGNRFTTVPKDALKRRGICIEPSINLFYQLGAGEAIRKCLKSSGIDIVNLQPIHKGLARRASLDRMLATIDLSNASDTICSNLVKLLLPFEWFTLLDSLRSHHTFVNGKWVLLEKFSSMGNGYTFELETLLFLAIARCACKWDHSECDNSYEETVSVYGDDIIVPTRHALNVIRALEFFGMKTNRDKTFVDGPFRESCGGDYFNGADVRPYFLKESPNEPQHFIAIANGLYRVGKNALSPCGDKRPYHTAWLSCVDALPTVIRACKGPERLGDIVLHQEEDRWIETRRERNGIHYLRCYRPVKPRGIGWHHFRPGVVLASALYGSGDGTSGGIEVGERTFFDFGGVFPRQPDTLSYKLGWVAQS